MCGLAGELRLDGEMADRAAVERMVACQTRRGPDGEGIWTRGPVALGHRRLAIIDLSEKGSQPMVDTKLGLTIVTNGCIYNYQDLRAELVAHGHTFVSTSDTEVILKAYATWGLDCVDHRHCDGRRRPRPWAPRARQSRRLRGPGSADSRC